MLPKVVRPFGLAACLAIVSTAVPTRADGPAPCFEAFASGQRLLASAKLMAAQSSFGACVNDTTCPAPPLLKDCAEQLAAVNRRVPSIVVVADKAPPNTKIFIDADATPRDLDGRAIDLDPGYHDVELRSPEARVATRVLMAEGQKLERVALAFHVESVPPPPLRRLEPTPHRSHAATWILGGVGIAALGAFGVLGAVGQVGYDGCVAQGCSSSAVDTLSIERGTAWAALGVGVVSLSVATVLFFLRDGRPTSHAARPWLLAF
jgi:hypothetical protein